MPSVKEQLIEAGFDNDHPWQPGKGKALFTVAKKAVG